MANSYYSDLGGSAAGMLISAPRLNFTFDSPALRSFSQRGLLAARSGISAKTSHSSTEIKMWKVSHGRILYAVTVSLGHKNTQGAFTM